MSDGIGDVPRLQPTLGVCVGVCALVAAVLLTSRVAAQEQAALWTTCTGRPDVGWEQQLKSCTAIIESKREEPARLAVAYTNRGVAQLELTAGGTVLPDNRAMADFGEAIKLNPDYADAYYHRGRLWHANGVLHNAVDLYSYAIKLNPRFAAAYRQRGLATLMMGDAAGARADLTETIRLTPNEAGAYLERSYALLAAREIDGALADLTEAIRIDPKLVVAYRDRGAIWVEKNDFDRAVADFSEAIRLEPGDADHHMNRGYANFLRGDYTTAAADLDRASTLNPAYHREADIALYRYLARIRAGQDGQAELKAARTYHSTLVFELYLGEATPEETLKSGAPTPVSGATPRLSTLERCEAEFHVGQWHLMRGEREPARRHLEAAAANQCSEGFPHHRAAEVELRHMGR